MFSILELYLLTLFSAFLDLFQITPVLLTLNIDCRPNCLPNQGIHSCSHWRAGSRRQDGLGQDSRQHVSTRVPAQGPIPQLQCDSGRYSIPSLRMFIFFLFFFFCRFSFFLQRRTDNMGCSSENSYTNTLTIFVNPLSPGSSARCKYSIL